MDESLNYEAIIAQLQVENELLRLRSHIGEGTKFSLPTIPSVSQIEKFLREHYLLVMVSMVLIAFITQMIVVISERIAHP